MIEERIQIVVYRKEEYFNRLCLQYDVRKIIGAKYVLEP